MIRNPFDYITAAYLEDADLEAATTISIHVRGAIEVLDYMVKANMISSLDERSNAYALIEELQAKIKLIEKTREDNRWSNIKKPRKNKRRGKRLNENFEFNADPRTDPKSKYDKEIAEKYNEMMNAKAHERTERI